MIKRTALALLLSSSSLVGCITSPAIPSQQRPQHWGTMLNQRDNFYQISEHVFRSEQPTAELIPQLKIHHIDVVINLRSRNADLNVLASSDFKLVHIPIHTWAMSREDLLQVMRQIQQAKILNQKVLIHCYHGSDRTGASIAMYRIIFENWKIEDALNEMKHGGYGFHPVWIHIEKIFSPKNVKWIQQQLSNPS
ncbi:dual specificity protein phosphatase family protein [Acinetobacter terrae]|jgi:protein tyrosine/serine phosphatase|uniref:Protein tyrosine phosphatase n=1 Tax=Acinetobacter terrae TaxID=2731247 RepID=A0A4R0EML1_9GAMM|nr:dual specificity protein phosphatase family protein [Acinetobacter terrae]OAL87551.1 protein tyrosine phosphatase [Acinetobacter terrae]TCB59283.1 protein tyrosine phosphatase [Acinetobacter terrae]